MWYNAENNEIGAEKQNKKNKAENIPVLSGRLVDYFNAVELADFLLGQLRAVFHIQ